MSDPLSSGHLFIVDGDLSQVACDALLVPVDERHFVMPTWTGLLGVDRPGALAHRPFDGRRAMPYEPLAGEEPAVWLGDVGRDGAEESWYADGLVEFVRSAAPVVRADRGRRIPRLAVNVAGAGAGGSGHDKKRLFRTIVPALDDVARSEHADVVLVCWGAKDHAAAQRARLRLGHASPLAHHPDLDATAQALAARAKLGTRPVPWRGSLDGRRPAVVAGAARRPLGEVGAGSIDMDRFHALDVRDQAQLVAQRFPSAEDYERAVHRHISTGSCYSWTHALLAGLGTRDAVTTNYDNLYESAASTAGRTCAVLPYESVPSHGRWVLKLHGSVDRPSDLVLTRRDDLGLPERAGALFGSLQAMLLLTRVTCFSSGTR